MPPPELSDLPKAQRDAIRRRSATPASPTPSADLNHLPALPVDLTGWQWEREPDPRGLGSAICSFARLVLPNEGLATQFHDPAYAIDEARRIIVEEAERDAAAAAALGEEQPATAWQPGPDAAGVYRRRPGMPERIMVAPRDLVDGRWQPRETYAQEALDELTASVREHGVLEDLIAIVNELGELELVTGHRRKRAAQAAGGRDVPVRVAEVTLAQAYEIAIISNDQRADLSDLERGKAYERMIAEQGISEAELARRLGRARAYIQQRRMLTQACPELQEALTAGQIGFTQARAICQGSGASGTTPGDAAAQQAALKQALNEAKSGRPARAEDLQVAAERAIREGAAATLNKLGWKNCNLWVGNKNKIYWFGGAAIPAEWSPAEMTAVARELRRPPEGQPEVAQLTKADTEVLSRRGWSSSVNFAPWPAVSQGDGYTFGEAALAAAAKARADIAALEGRFAAAGWLVTWKYGTYLVASTGKGDKKRVEERSSYAEAIKLIGQIEKGTLPAQEKGSSQNYSTICDICRHRKEDTKRLDGKNICPDCAPPIEARLAAQCAAISAAIEAANVADWLRQAPAFAADLLLTANYRAWTEPMGHAGYLRDEDVDRLIGSLTPAQRQEALGHLVATVAWDQRDHTTARHLAPAPAPNAPASLPALPGDGIPIVAFAEILVWLDELEQRIAAGTAAEVDLELLADHLELLADDETVGLDAYEAALIRLDDLADRIVAPQREAA